MRPNSFPILFTILLGLFLFLGSGCHKSSNSSSSWHYAATGTTATIMEVEFLRADTGYFLADANGQQSIYQTIDDGQNWQKLTTFDAGYPPFQCFYPISGNTLIAARDTLYVSSDGGLTWHKGTGPDQAFIGSVIHFSLSSDSLGYALAAGGVYKTSDGIHWNLIRALSSPYNFIQFTDPLHGFIAGGSTIENNGSVTVGSYGLLSKTSDGGLTWQDLNTGSWINNMQNFTMITGLSLLSNSTGYIATDDQKLLATNDGTTFIAQTTSTPTTTSSLYFQTPTTGFYVQTNLIYGTTDGGSTWKLQLKASNNLIAVRGTPDGGVCAYGYGGILLVRH